MTYSSSDIAVVLGTRPEIIKMASVIRALGDRARVIHTGQHWDEAMAGQFFSDLGIGEPHVRLARMTGVNRVQQIGRGIAELADHFEEHPVAAVIVQGDTNSTSVGAQAAAYMDIPVIHVEAGLRSFDRAMPEEINRLVVGAVADLHCAATPQARSNLLAEGVDPARILVTGNTVVEATLAAMERAPEQYFNSSASSRRILATIHRPENTDDPGALKRILDALVAVDAHVVLAVHPRTAAATFAFGLSDRLEQIDSRPGLGHADFLALARQADLIISDSGGVQEEVTVLKKPLLVVRRSTERPETIAAGFAELVTPERDLSSSITAALNADWSHLASTPSPYGDGKAGQKVALAALNMAYTSSTM